MFPAVSSERETTRHDDDGQVERFVTVGTELVANCNAAGVTAGTWLRVAAH